MLLEKELLEVGYRDSSMVRVLGSRLKGLEFKYCSHAGRPL